MKALSILLFFLMLMQFAFAQNDKQQKLNSYEKERQELKINSKLDKNSTSIKPIIWVDKKTYQRNETIRIVVEIHKEINYDGSEKLTFNNNLKLQFIKKAYSHQFNNGKESSYIIFFYKAIKTGKIKVKPFKVLIDGKLYITKKIKFKIV
ncbi:MAG: BatD family protein [Flavobacteriaceae bacterium]|nr:BatD family protein [Flavobacteriaceae bacterium]